MSGIELIAFGTLWVVLAVLAGLVLLLYRQVEKAYSSATGLVNVGLVPGVEAPDIEVMTQHGVEPLEFPPPGKLALLAFLTPRCDACVQLVDALKELDLPLPAYGLVSGEDLGEITSSRDGSFQALWVAHPPDVIKNYGVATTPLVYVVRGRTILASKAVSSAPAVQELLEEAQAFEQERHLETVGVEVHGQGPENEET